MKNVKRKKEDKAYLSWKREDFVRENVEIPNSLMFDDFHTEGEMMSEDEIVQWVLDTEKSFSIIKEQDEKTFEKVYAEYVKDLDYLVKIKRITRDAADEIINRKNFEL